MGGDFQIHLLMGLNHPKKQQQSYEQMRKEEYAICDSSLLLSMSNTDTDYKTFGLFIIFYNSQCYVQNLVYR